MISTTAFLAIQLISGYTLRQSLNSLKVLNLLFDLCLKANNIITMTYICASCENESKDFYSDIYFGTGLLPVCKECLIK